MMLLEIFYGFICGTVMGLTGGGGSILAVPMLVYLVKVPFHSAVAVALIVVIASAIFGLLLKLKKSEIIYSAGIIFAITGIIFAPIGSYISTLLNAKILGICFACLMLVVGSLTWLKSRNNPNMNSSNETARNNKLSIKSIIVLLQAGIVAGLLAGMFGVGGGFIIVPTLLLTIQMPIKKAIATSLMVMTLVALSGLLSHIRHTTIPWEIVGIFVLGAIIGMFAATGIRDKINAQLLQKIFAVILIILGFTMLYLHIKP